MLQTFSKHFKNMLRDRRFCALHAPPPQKKKLGGGFVFILVLWVFFASCVFLGFRSILRFSLFLYNPPTTNDLPRTAPPPTTASTPHPDKSA